MSDAAETAREALESWPNYDHTMASGEYVRSPHPSMVPALAALDSLLAELDELTQFLARLDRALAAEAEVARLKKGLR